MVADRYRTPIGVPRPTLASRDGEGAGADLLSLLPAPDLAPHPDFAARVAIWRMQADGLISLAEAQRRSANIGRAAAVREARRLAPARPRHTRAEPNQSRQYARDMATTAARDDRLTPNAKAFLQVLRARCGKGRETTITKGTAGNIMARSTRTIRRYLVDLVRFGYVELAIAKNARGLHLGLTIRLTERVLPFYEEAKGLARWLAETPAALFRPFAGKALGLDRVTLLSSKNQTQTIHPPESSRPMARSRQAASEKLWKRGGASSMPDS
ncbi:hypothetical protein GCM10011390_33500 [Aureimonas endophytica]|uniref:Uncharacterized protein n=1 Tax=Aureimonas endophytica TaxID=2027858 RepID=A0A916ZTE1_9HYPH|nr:helix-turn-helix domain-containing protein [Aureimonas endophytica]GGE11677.1 hypothetical protein GCM10011390_33500 [Aureimonas endophytica]